MTTIALVKEAIAALNDRTGSSVIAINKYIEGEKKTLVKKHVMRAALKRGVEDGTLTMVKNSYKLSSETKKKAAVLKPVHANKNAKTKKNSSSTTTTKGKAPKKTTKAAPNTSTAKKTTSGAKTAKTTAKKTTSKTKKSVQKTKAKEAPGVATQ